MKKAGLKNFFLSLLIISLIFTLADLFLHYTLESIEIYYYPIPEFLKFISTSSLIWYGIGKFFGTIILGLLLYPLIKKIKSYKLKILLFTLIIVIILEVRYLISGYYDSIWHTINFINHFIVLFVSSYYIFKIRKSLVY